MKQKSRWMRRFLAIVLTLVMVIGCGVWDIPVYAKGVKADKTSVVIPAGGSDTVTISYGSGAHSFRYSMSPSGIITANPSFGTDSLSVSIKGIKPGNTELVFTIGSDSVTIKVTVTGNQVKKRTKSQIRSFIKKSKVTTRTTTKYSKRPSTSAPYEAGSLSKATKQSAVKMLNNIRYIAGLNSNVKINESYCKLAQAATLANAANHALSHYPSKPAGMSESLYSLCAKGASSSNLAWGYGNLNSALLDGWMDDGDAGNIDRVGHRRWVLNPSMKKVGFGQTDTFTAMYAFDSGRKGKETNIFWPAQTMPLEYFGDRIPWSVSTGQVLSESKIKVVMTRKSDKHKWTFSSTSKSGYFHVDNAGYGLPGCIIFRPDGISYKDGDVFHIEITGVPNGDIAYDVTFFKL